ncbi:Flagellar hook protein FlgE [bioreactor metagenome]|uniref:Flagellar hook protein FlgE n=1 Tax=bioreactor metagenome TaxID=1076179 RepID=A0A645H9W0_9ZZZZ
MALATFNNPSGLNKVGDNMYTQSNNSGIAQVGPANSGGRGKFNPGSLEMANVDLAQEFSNMIITQRGFQANSKIISVSDEMLQELANLKR